MNPNLPDDLQGRLLQWLDGELDENEANRLDTELLGNPGARALYIQIAALHSALEDRYASQASNRGTPLVPVERLLVR
jgi:anti-sigma factor RsiW